MTCVILVSLLQSLAVSHTCTMDVDCTHSLLPLCNSISFSFKPLCFPTQPSTGYNIQTDEILSSDSHCQSLALQGKNASWEPIHGEKLLGPSLCKTMAIECLCLQQQCHIWMEEFYDALSHPLAAKFFPSFHLWCPLGIRGQDSWKGLGESSSATYQQYFSQYGSLCLKPAMISLFFNSPRVLVLKLFAIPRFNLLIKSPVKESEGQFTLSSH